MSQPRPGKPVKVQVLALLSARQNIGRVGPNSKCRTRMKIRGVVVGCSCPLNRHTDAHGNYPERPFSPDTDMAKYPCRARPRTAAKRGDGGYCACPEFS